MSRPRRPPDNEPTPDRQMPLPLSRKKLTPTPEQVARKTVGRLPSPPGQADKAEVVFRLALKRQALERLTVRAMEQGRRIEGLVQDVLEAAAEE